jgi:amidohydrolase
MSSQGELSTRLDAAVDRHAPLLFELARKLHAEPELRFREEKAVAWITELVQNVTGRSVERQLGGLHTAFRSRFGSSSPRVGILAEYDALPEIGHACGHNLIAAGAVGAFLALSDCASELNGSVDLIGTPAEEGGGGKILLIEAGVFQGIDAAMMFHPFDRDVLAHPSLANMWITFEFQGAPAHAAIAPWNGSSALTACLQTFHLIDSQRVHFRDGVRVHGYVTNGGQAVNIIPERAACEFSVRATTVPELKRVQAIVERCARGAAMAAGVDLSIKVQRGYKDLRNNLALARSFGRQMERLGRTVREKDPRVGAGSTDMGDVSHAVPAIHPWVGICDEGAAQCHQREFAASAVSDRGLSAMVVAAKAMANTTAEFLADKNFRATVRAEFETLEG